MSKLQDQICILNYFYFFFFFILVVFICSAARGSAEPSEHGAARRTGICKGVSLRRGASCVCLDTTI